jgi:hypothetical protein
MDSGCSVSLLSVDVVRAAGWTYGSCLNRIPSLATLVHDVDVPVVGAVHVAIDGVWLDVGVVESLPGGFTVCVGLDVVSRIGQLTVGFPRGPTGPCVSTLSAFQGSAAGVLVKEKDKSTTVIENPDGSVILRLADCEVRRHTLPDGTHKWTASWRWIDGIPLEGPEQVLSGPVEYSRKLSAEDEAAFQAELAMWVKEGWLIPAAKDDVRRVLPLIAVLQKHKVSTPVRPVLDYRALNELICSVRNQDTASVTATLRKWRHLQTAVFLDIRKAYMQIGIARHLWPFQGVCVNGVWYLLAVMGFGWANAPKVLRAVVKYILRDVEGADDFFDDLAVEGDAEEGSPAALLMASQQVADLMRQNNLVTKPPQALCGSTVLGLKVDKAETVLRAGCTLPAKVDVDSLVWRRRISVPEMLERFHPDEVHMWTYKFAAGFAGCLTSHVPVAGRLRCVTAVLKRYIGQRTGPGRTGWNRKIDAPCIDIISAI